MFVVNTSKDAEVHEVNSKPLMQSYLLDNCYFVSGVYPLGRLPGHFQTYKYTC